LRILRDGPSSAIAGCRAPSISIVPGLRRPHRLGMAGRVGPGRLDMHGPVAIDREHPAGLEVEVARAVAGVERMTRPAATRCVTADARGSCQAAPHTTHAAHESR
jgi:hypothetical protein